MSSPEVAGDDGRLDVFSATPRDSFNIEYCDRHTASFSVNAVSRIARPPAVATAAIN
jgi:hypothetical protein